MSVLIFGAAGGIGRHAVKHALAKGYQVTAYLRDKNAVSGGTSGFGQGHERGRRKTACGLGYAKRSI